MSARLQLVPTTAERNEWYFEGMYEGDMRYNADAADIPDDVQDPDRHTTGGPSDTEGPSSRRSHTEGADPEMGDGSPVRQRRVRFSLPRQPRAGGDSRGGVGGHPEVRSNICTTLFNLNPVKGFSTDRVRTPFRTAETENLLK